MIILVPTYIFALFLILAAGLAILLLLKHWEISIKTDQPLTIYFIWGVIILSTLTATISLFISINNWVLIGVAGIVFLILVIHHRETSQILLSKWNRARLMPIPVIIFGLVLLLVTISVNETLRPGDTGGYHAQAVRWLTDYGAVAGIGNIIPRVAFNNHLFVFASLFDAFWMKGQFHLLINGLFFLFGSIFFLESAAAIYQNRKVEYKTLLGIFIVLPLLHFEPHVLNTLYVEMSVALMLIFLVSIYLSENFTQHNLILISALTGLLLSYKASLLPVTLLLIPLLFLRSDNNYSLERPHRILIVLTPFIIVLIPFLARNIILSGYPLYPMPLANYWPFHFEWQMTVEQVQYQIRDIKYWARTTGDHTNYKIWGATTFAWILPWFKAVFHKIPFLFTGLLLSLLVLLYQLIRSVRRHELTKIQLWIWGLPILSLVWWFIQAPNIRLGFPWIFLAIGLATVLVIDALQKHKKVGKSPLNWSLKPNQILVAFILTCFLLLLAKGSGIFTRIIGVESHLITQITPMPKAEVDTLAFNDGNLTVFLASKSKYGSCYYHQPPCTPEVGGNGVQYGIKKLGEDISSGFSATDFTGAFEVSREK